MMSWTPSVGIVTIFAVDFVDTVAVAMLFEAEHATSGGIFAVVISFVIPIVVLSKLSDL